MKVLLIILSLMTLSFSSFAGTEIGEQKGATDCPKLNQSHAGKDTKSVEPSTEEPKKKDRGV